jgi:hypothetical protein
MYRTVFHEDLGYLETEISGFWTLDEVYALDRDIAQHINRYARRFPHFAILSDSRTFAVQSAEVSEAFAACSAAATRRHTGLIAVVIDSALARMQTRRIVGDGWTQCFFTDMEEARAYVEADARARAETKPQA